MRILKNILSQLHRFAFWTIILALFWIWIYANIGDPAPEKKIVIYIDAYEVDQRGLSLRLEEEGLPEGIKLIQVRTGDYIFASSNSPIKGDLYLLKESVLKTNLEQTPDQFAPVSVPDGMTGFSWEGKTWGIQVYNAAEKAGAAMNYICYSFDGDPEPDDYYLCFDADSCHVAGLPNAVDNAAWEVVLNLLSINDG